MWYHIQALCSLHVQATYAYEATVSRRGSAMVIDGHRLLLTPLRHTVVPPPMSTLQIQLPAVTTTLAFRDLGDSEVSMCQYQTVARCFVSCL